MADKKLNEVPVVSDIVTIFGKRSNGEIVQIDKSNLATLLGELLPLSTNTNKGLTRRTDTCCERNKQRTCLERRLYRQT